MQSLKIGMVGLAVVGVALTLASQASALIIFEDDFESTTPGNEPAGWASGNANGTTATMNVVAGENSPFGSGGDNQALNFFDQDAGVTLTANRSVVTGINGISGIIKISYDVKFDTIGDEYTLTLVGDFAFPSAGLTMGSGRGVPAAGQFINNRGGSFDLLEPAKADTWYRIEILTSDIGVGAPVDTVTYSIQEFGQPATVYAPLPFRQDTSELISMRFIGNLGGISQIDSLIDNFKVEVIPEPASALLMLIGLGIVPVLSRRARTSKRLG